MLCYHNIVPAGADPGEPGLHLDAGTFERQIAWLAQRYEWISLAELAWRIRNGASLRRRLAVTFDDAYVGVFEHAVPVLRRYGVPATVFVVTQGAATGAPFRWDRAAAAGRPLPASHHPATWDQIARVAGARGLSVGVHTCTHPSLPSLPDRLLWVELREARRQVAERIGVMPTFAAYPFGHWNRRVRNAARAAGFDGAVTLDYATAGPGADLWSLPRINVPAGLAHEAFPAWVAGFRPHRLIA